MVAVLIVGRAALAGAGALPHANASEALTAGAQLAVAVGAPLMAALLGFVAFRLFDVWKPPPIGWLDRRVGGGVGVVADDLLAGVYAGLLVRVLVEFM